MAVIWNDERLTPERVIELLEEQQKYWLETADSFERLKSYLSGTLSMQDAENSAATCRERARALEGRIRQMRDQCQIIPPLPPHDSPMLWLQ
jgi:hypothetical protein